MLCAFKKINVMHNWMNQQKNQVVYAASKIDWIDSEIFGNWFFQEIFLDNTPSEGRVILICGSRGSHTSQPPISPPRSSLQHNLSQFNRSRRQKRVNEQKNQKISKVNEKNREKPQAKRNKELRRYNIKYYTY